MNKLTKFIILVFGVSLFSILGFGILTEAGSEHNVSGFGYSETIDWVSFNSTNCDSNGDGWTDTGNFSQCSVGQVISNYGVNLDLDTGDLSGQAWSTNIGWISFNRSVTGNPPSQPYKTGTGAIAKVEISSGKITGWFRALANGGGWDGWYRFCDEDMTYCDNADQIAKIDYDDGDWHGWAWTSLVGGWLSFNGADSGAGGDYKVNIAGGLNRPPSAINLSTTASVTDYCSKSPANIFLNWEFSDQDTGHTQSAYQVQVTRVSDGQAYDSGKLLGSASSRTAFNINSDMGSLFIWYDLSQQGYTWRVKVWDSQDAESDWADGPLFRTPLHQYPLIDFNWSPTEPSQGENVLFSDQSTVYGGSTKSAWSWTFTDGNPATSALQNQTIQFTSDGSKQVTLQVTDSDSFSCQISKPVGVQVALPEWEEILPR